MLQFRSEPLAEPRKPPSLDKGPAPRSAVVWRPELAPGGSLVRGVLVEVAEGVVVAERLVHANGAEAVRETAGYCRSHRADVAPGGLAQLGLFDMAGAGKFLRSRSYRSGWALVVEAVPDLASLSVAEKWHNGTTSLHLAGLVGPDGTCWPSQPRVLVSLLGGHLMARWGSSKRATLPDGNLEGLPKRGPIPGLLTLAAALAGAVPEGLDLRHACGLFGVEVPEPTDGHPFSALRAEAAAMARLWLVLVDELDRLGLPLGPGHIASPGTVANVLVAATGLPPLAGRFDLDDRLRGAAASAYHGGWHEARVIGPAVSAVLADLSHAHLRGAITLGATRYLTARSVHPVEKTSAFRRLLASPGLADLALSDVRRRWGVTLVAVRPRGEPWPYQAGGKFTVGPLDLQGDLLWCHWQDVVAAALRSGRTPEVVEAWHLRPVGKVRGLRPVRLLSGRLLDLGSGDDLFEALVAERYLIAEDESLDPATRARRVAFAKALALMAYGLLARTDRERVGKKATDAAITFDGRRAKHRNGWLEVPGPWAWLPLAGAITASTRLTVAAAMAGLAAEGGDWLHVAADSLVIAATHRPEPEHVALPDGAKICCLPLRTVEKVLAHANVLYRGGTAWKHEEGWEGPAVALVSGINRFGFLYEDGRLAHLAEASLGGVLIDPTGEGREGAGNGSWAWSQRLHGAYVRHVAHGGKPGTLPDDLPSYADLPALYPSRATTKAELARLQAAFGPEARPFAVYTTLCPVADNSLALALGHVSPARVRQAAWRTATGQSVELADDEEGRWYADGQPVRAVRTYFFATWLREARKPGLREPSLLVSSLAEAVPVGKLSEWATYQPGLVTDSRDGLLSAYLPRAAYRRGGISLSDGLRAALAGMTAPRLAELAGIAPRTARALLAGRPPSRATLEKLAPVLGDLAPAPVRGCLGCGRELTGRQRSFCAKCRSSYRGQERAHLVPRCLKCGTVRYGDTDGPCPVCADLVLAEISGPTCPGCGAIRLGDTAGPCPVCHPELARRGHGD